MPSNVEIKARLFDREKAICVAGQLSGSEGELLEQDDTFFSVAQGRLKLRVQSTSGHAVAMLIQYHRPDKEGPKLSDYTIATTQTPEELKTILTQCLGTVRKQRRLFVVGQTRIHIDTVQGLGEFLELEVVLRPGQLPSEGESIANDLMGQLGVTPDNLVSGAYVDLLYKQHTALGHPT
jgi:predicted adenylyl cyclase CyaB